jgi:hypothetical protein
MYKEIWFCVHVIPIDHKGFERNLKRNGYNKGMCVWHFYWHFDNISPLPWYTVDHLFFASVLFRLYMVLCLCGYNHLKDIFRGYISPCTSVRNILYLSWLSAGGIYMNRSYGIENLLGYTIRTSWNTFVTNVYLRNVEINSIYFNLRMTDFTN